MPPKQAKAAVEKQVGLTGLDSRVGVLCLQQQLDTLDGSNHCLGNASSDSTSSQISKELHGSVLGLLRHNSTLLGSWQHERLLLSAAAARM